MSGAASVGMHKRGKTLHLEVSKDQSYSPQDPPPTAFLMRAEQGRRERGKDSEREEEEEEGGTLFLH